MSPRRAYRRPANDPPLDPPTFLRRLATKVGTDYGHHLVIRAVDFVEHGDNPDPWIQEVRRARDAGVIGAALARFLIYTFAEAALSAVIYTDPVLSALMKRIDRIREEHGLRDDEDWHVDEGPPEWNALNRRWDVAANALINSVFRRNGETELSADELHGDDALFEEGRRLVVGPESEDEDEDEGTAGPSPGADR
jgi:hypothetical protein